MEKAEVLYNIWKEHGGREAELEVFQTIVEKSYRAKAHIRNHFLDGKEKKEIEVTQPKELSMADAIAEARNYLIRQEKNVRICRSFDEVGDAFFEKIFNNDKISQTDEEERYSLARLVYFQKNDNDHDIYINLLEAIETEDFPSPKLTKQVLQLGKIANLPSEQVNNILSVLSQIQSFAPKNQTKTIKIVLSVDPIDFATCSLNSYNWTSCSRPEGEHATMPYSLMLDRYSCIAYIESTKTKYVAFHHGEESYVVSNKKMRAFLHFGERYESILFNRVYPNGSVAFYDCLSNFFLEKGYELQNTDYYDYIIIDMSSHVYDDVAFYDSAIFATTYNDFHIGETPPCLHCGNINNFDFDEYDPDEEYEIERGLCVQCIHEYNYLEEGEY